MGTLAFERGASTLGQQMAFQNELDAIFEAARKNCKSEDPVMRQRLADAWAEGPRTFLGIQVSGFPNLFTVTGPGSPSVLSNMIPSIEQHVNWIADCLAALSAGGVATIEANPEAEDDDVEHVVQHAVFQLVR